MNRSLMVLVCAGITSMACISQAQNLLVNGDLEASPVFTYFDGSDPTLADDVPGWTLFGHTPPDASSWIQVAYDNGSGSIDLDLSGSETDATDGDFTGLSGAMTATASRPAVTPGVSYIASVEYDNYFTNAGISYFIDWFDGGGVLLSSSGGLLGDVNSQIPYTPTELYQITGTAPASAAAAGVRFQSSNGFFAGAAADNFSLNVVPEPATMSLLALAGFGLLGRRGSRR